MWDIIKTILTFITLRWLFERGGCGCLTTIISLIFIAFVVYCL